jgi:hypothetical protein
MKAILKLTKGQIYKVYETFREEPEACLVTALERWANFIMLKFNIQLVDSDALFPTVKNGKLDSTTCYSQPMFQTILNDVSL